MSNPAPPTETLPPMTPRESRIKALMARSNAKPVLRPAWSIVLLAWLVRLSAVINLVSSVLPEVPKLIYWLQPWMPFEISEGTRILMFMTSMLFFILASGLEKGKRTAWLLTMATLAIAPILHFGHATIWWQMLINLGLIIFLLLHHHHFVVRSDLRSVRSGLAIYSLLAILLLTFGTVRLHDLRDETSGGDDWVSCMQTAFELVLVPKQPHSGSPDGCLIQLFCASASWRRHRCLDRTFFNATPGFCATTDSCSRSGENTKIDQSVR